MLRWHPPSIRDLIINPRSYSCTCESYLIAHTLNSSATGLALAPGGPGLRCWVCGEDATPHDTNPESRQEQIKQTEQLGIAAPALQPNSLKTSWCSSRFEQQPEGRFS